MATPTKGSPSPVTGRPQVLPGAGGGRALGGFFLSGVLFSFLGPLLPAWGYHLRSDYATVGFYFLFLVFGIYGGSQVCHLLVPRVPLRTLLAGSSALAAAGFLALAALPQVSPPSYKMFALFAIGWGGSMTTAALFHAIAPLYERNAPSTVTLSGGLFGMGCLTAALLTAGSIELYSVESMLLLLAAIPLLFTWSFLAGPHFPASPHTFPSVRQALDDFRSPGAILFALLLFFQFGNEWAIAGWLPLFLIQQLGMSPANGILMLALYWVALLAGRFIAQAMLPRMRPSRVLMLSVLAALFGCVLLSLTEKMGGAVAGVILIGGGFASIYPLTVESIAHRFPYYHPGFFGGIFTLALMGGLLTPGLLGFVAGQWGVGKVMLIPAIGSIMVCVLVMLIWLERRLSGEAAQ